ncbi:PREDICTED: odorant receptor 13a-like isoform X2 [Wasmannia auropunctata]|uniref:odorant receptor 13a-like isoform X2 n=1 Tax=Wasmannia auropunctata TaxID=64793 RepID=UPI0005EDD838|nr:PREDICTED: odorant receptor 13a-like isoform X2 [Wasmannia auropunctata]
METWRHYYDFVCKFSSLTGTWPYLKPRTRKLRVALLTVTTLTVFVPQIAYQFTCKTDVRCMFEAMTSYLLTIVALLKVYTFQLNTRTLKDLTQHLFVDWKGLESPKEYEIMRSYAKNSRRFCLVYAAYCLAAVVTFMSISLIPFVLDIVWPLNESRPIVPPYPGYYFVDTREYFFKIFWHSVVAWEIIMAGIVAHDCMLLTYIEHVCSLFATVGFRFENLFCNSDETLKIADDSNDTYRKRTAFFVHAHREAIKLAELLEDTFTVPFAIQMLIVTVGISITLLQVTQQQGDILESVRYVVYVIGQLIHLFILSFEGQKLIDHSLQTCDKIYGSSWYEVSASTQKLIMLVMMKSVRPSFLSAGKIYIFSLESFTTVLQTSMSYFTVFASVQ